MAFAYLTGVYETPGGDGGSTSGIDTTGATLIVVAISRFNIATLSDSKGNSWSQGNVRSELYYCINPTVGSGHTFTYAASIAAPAISVACYSGSDPVFDQTNVAKSAAVSALATGSVTPTVNNSLLVAVHAWETTDNYTIDLSFTERSDMTWVNNVNIGGGLADKILASAAAQNPTFTASNSTDRISQIITFYEDATVINLTGNSIASGEAFGTPPMVEKIITGTGIASEEAFGSPQLNKTMTMVGIASAEAFGSLMIPQVVYPTGIATAEAFGSPSVRTKLILPTGIASAESFSSPTLYTWANKTYYGSVSGADAFFAARFKSYHWDQASNVRSSLSEKEKALQHATYLIDRFDYLDYKYAVRTVIDAADDDTDWTTDANQLILRNAWDSQPNEFPRGLSAAVPSEIERATYLIAYALLAGRNPESDLEGLAIKNARYGDVRTTWQRGGNNQEHMAHLIPSAQAFNLIRPFFRERDAFTVQRV
jgi:hypothetical protein